MLEGYVYDRGHHPTSFFRQGTGMWSYAPSTRFDEVPSRTRGSGAGPVTDSFTYDPVTSRLETWDTSGLSPIARDFQYDGAGRLVQMVRTDSTGTRATDLVYDVDDTAVWERQVQGGVTHTTWRHSG